MYKSKKILILGMARSGFEVAKLLSKYDNEITITDMKEQDPENVKILKELGVNYVITDEPEKLLDNSFDVLVKNPGIRRDHKCVLKARALDMDVVNEVEVAYSFLNKNAKIIAITGSNGKTTTTTMIFNILKQAGLDVLLGGNIGYPVSSLVPKVKDNSILVLEISDHQLVDMHDFKSNISILTNLYQVHLDFHESYAVYKNMKKKIFNKHTEDDLAILNKNNIDVLNLTEDINSNKLYFSSTEEADCMIKNDAIYYKGEEIIKLKDIKLKGVHNYENIMCAIMAVKEFNVSNEIIFNYLNKFGGVEHRIEYVDTIDGVEYYNDSKATNVDSTIIAVDSFKNPTILLLGGLDRGHSFEPLKGHLDNVKLIISYGETKNRIKAFADSENIKCIVVDTLVEATHEAIKNAKENYTVLLSPACASWDQYKCFEDRGEEFKKEVFRIKK